MNVKVLSNHVVVYPLPPMSSHVLSNMSERLNLETWKGVIKHTGYNEDRLKSNMKNH